MTLQKYKYTGWGCLCSLAIKVLSLLAFTSTKVQILTLCLVNAAILRTRYILILLALLVQKYKYWRFLAVLEQKYKYWRFFSYGKSAILWRWAQTPRYLLVQKYKYWRFSFFFFSYSADYGRKRRDISAGQELPPHPLYLRPRRALVLNLLALLAQISLALLVQRASSTSARSPPPPSSGTHFTGFTGTKVHILTQKALPGCWWQRARRTDTKTRKRLLSQLLLEALRIYCSNISLSYILIFQVFFFLISLFFLKRCASYILIFQVSFFFHFCFF